VRDDLVTALELGAVVSSVAMGTNRVVSLFRACDCSLDRTEPVPVLEVCNGQAM
jgi:hypothetical protein